MATTLLLTGIAVYVAFAGLMFFAQERLLFLPNMPSRSIVATPKDISMDYAPVNITTEDDIELDAWFVPNTEARATLLFFHGNAGNISHRLDSIKIFHRLRMNVFIFDYRGYGRSTGNPSESGVYKDAQAAWQHLTQDRGIPPREILLFGRSLGGAIATWLAVRTQAGGLIIESTFTSVPDLAAKLYPFLPVRLLARLDFNTRKALHSVQIPVLVIHSRDDEIIPYSHGQMNYDSANEPKQFIELRGGHNDGFLVSESTYERGIQHFLQLHFDKD